VSRGRGGERGLSIIEAIVIATITALLALLILPLLPRAASSSAQVAERGIDALDAMRAEREFRALVRAVSQRQVDGEPQQVIVGNGAAVVMQAGLSAPVACARSGAPAVRLAIQGTALFCDSEGRRRPLLRWQRGSVGVLSYSVDGVSWADGWSGVRAAPYVRFQLRERQRVRLSWVERVSGSPP